MKERYNFMKRKLSLILIISGIIVILIPLLGNIYSSYKQNELIRQYEQYIISDSERAKSAEQGQNKYDNYKGLQGVFSNEENNANTTINQERKSNTPNSTQTSNKKSNPFQNQKVLGIIKIKKIKIEVPIVEGVEQKNLSIAVGHIPGTTFPGMAGNSVIAGHRSYTFGKFFNQLDKLEEGDEIIINTGHKEYTYKVFKIFVVEPTDTSILSGETDRSIITLVTCTPIYIASHRLIVQAELN